MTAGWEPVSGSFPWPPANGTAMSSFHGSDADIRWDDPSTLNTGPSTPSTRATVSVTVAGIPDVLTASTATFTLSGAPIAVADNHRGRWCGAYVSSRCSWRGRVRRLLRRHRDRGN